MSSNVQAVRLASGPASPISDTESTDRGTLSDQEKQEITAPSSDDGLLVKWGDNDLLNPRSFSVVVKWLIVCVISAATFLV